ncbi:hypothetical protein B0A93_02475 [Pseudomonas syringae]|nr:hypothetical protein B0A93_02475 [Pseudomonas syringae]
MIGTWLLLYKNTVIEKSLSLLRRRPASLKAFTQYPATPDRRAGHARSMLCIPAGQSTKR